MEHLGSGSVGNWRSCIHTLKWDYCRCLSHHRGVGRSVEVSGWRCRCGTGGSVGCVLKTLAKIPVAVGVQLGCLVVYIRSRRRMLESCSEVSCGDYKVGGERGGHGVLSWEPHECARDSFS
jgi:hypothetical protein